MPIYNYQLKEQCYNYIKVEFSNQDISTLFNYKTNLNIRALSENTRLKLDLQLEKAKVNYQADGVISLENEFNIYYNQDKYSDITTPYYIENQKLGNYINKNNILVTEDEYLVFGYQNDVNSIPSDFCIALSNDEFNSNFEIYKPLDHYEWEDQNNDFCIVKEPKTYKGIHITHDTNDSLYNENEKYINDFFGKFINEHTRIYKSHNEVVLMFKNHLPHFLHETSKEPLFLYEKVRLRKDLVILLGDTKLEDAYGYKLFTTYQNTIHGIIPQLIKLDN